MFSQKHFSHFPYSINFVKILYLRQFLRQKGVNKNIWGILKNVDADMDG